MEYIGNLEVTIPFWQIALLMVIVVGLIFFSNFKLALLANFISIFFWVAITYKPFSRYLRLSNIPPQHESYIKITGLALGCSVVLILFYQLTKRFFAPLAKCKHNSRKKLP
jgi:hypothetical protein